MIALLRCQNNVTSNDVERYISDFDGLMYKLQNINPADVPQSSLKNNEAKIWQLKKYFTDSTADDFNINSQYVKLLDWSEHFCVVVKAAHKVKELEDNINESKSELKRLTLLRERASLSLDDFKMLFYDKIKTDYVFMNDFLKSMSEENQASKKQQVVEMQTGYENYENEIFSGVK